MGYSLRHSRPYRHFLATCYRNPSSADLTLAEQEGTPLSRRPIAMCDASC